MRLSQFCALGSRKVRCEGWVGGAVRLAAAERRRHPGVDRDAVLTDDVVRGQFRGVDVGMLPAGAQGEERKGACGATKAGQPGRMRG